jgi:hypothetical protein
MPRPDHLAHDPRDPAAPVRTDDDDEDNARARTSIADLVRADLDDPSTPSHLDPDGVPVGLDVPLQDFTGGDDAEEPG